MPEATTPATEETVAPHLRFDRQAGLVDQEKLAHAHVTICGCGTVGSHAAVELARLGIGSLLLIDDDEVEEVNLPSQAFVLSDVGRLKTEALQDRVQAVSSFCTVTTLNRRLAGGEPFPAGPVILAVDSMDARKNILDLSVARNPEHPLVMDGRMAGSQMQLLCFDPTNEEALAAWQRDFWFPADQALPVPCGGQSVSFIGAYCGALMSSYIRTHIGAEQPPFFLQCDLDAPSQMTMMDPPPEYVPAPPPAAKPVEKTVVQAGLAKAADKARQTVERLQQRHADPERA